MTPPPPAAELQLPFDNGSATTAVGGGGATATSPAPLPAPTESTAADGGTSVMHCTWHGYFGFESSPQLRQHASAAVVQYAGAWQTHQYLFGALFALIAAHSLLALPRLWRRRHLLSRHSFALLTGGVGGAACLRAVQLVLDAHDSACASPPLAVYLLRSLVFPSLVSCASALVAAMVRSSGVVLPRDSRAVARALPCFVSFHLALALVALPTAYFFAAARPLLFAYQIFTAFWGLFLWLSYVALFRVMRERAALRQLNASRSLSKSMGLSSKHAARRHKLTLVLAVHGTMCVVCCVLALCLLETYQLVQGALPGGGSDAFYAGSGWRWWAAQTSSRLVEAAVCLSLSYVTLLPFRSATPVTAAAADVAAASGTGQSRRAGGDGGRRLRAVSARCREACCFYCSPCTQHCSGDDSNEYLISVADWTRPRDDDADDGLGLHQVKRQESTKSDLYPLHLVTRSGDGLTAAMLAAAGRRGGGLPGGGSGITGSTAMLAADRGKLSWTHSGAAPAACPNDAGNDCAASDGCISDISCCENPHYYHSTTDVSQQPTLKVERDLADAFADLQCLSPAVAAAVAAAAASAAAAESAAAAAESAAMPDADAVAPSTSQSAAVAGKQSIPEVLLPSPPAADSSAAAAESPSVLLQRVLRRTSPGRARNAAEVKCLLAVERSGTIDDAYDDDDDDISQLSVHVDDGQYAAEVEAHV